MNFGKMTATALLRADLPFDAEHTQLAKDYLNGNIQNFWNHRMPDWRTSWGELSVQANADEYILNKLCERIVKNSLRGATNDFRYLKYFNPSRFFRYVNDQEGTSSTPIIYTYGQMVGIDQQLISTTRIEAYSTLADKTDGTITVNAGSTRVTGVGTSFDKNDEGLRFKRSGDDKCYYIGKVLSATELELSSKYRGYTGASVNYTIGDVGVKLNVTGYVAGQVESEEIELNGENAISTSKTFTSLISISKDTSGGSIIARQQNDTTKIVATLAPSEEELERVTIKLYPIPSASETLKYRFVIRHPLLRLDSDRLLIPQRYHDGILAMTEADLREWADKPIPDKVSQRITDAWTRLVQEAETTSEEDVMTENDQSNIVGDYFTQDTDLLGNSGVV